MHTAVSICSTPRVFEALPAVKTRYYAEDVPLPHVYSAARFYFLRGGLVLSLCAFERAPSTESGLAFALCGESGGGRLLLCTLRPHCAEVRLLPPGAVLIPPPDGGAKLPYSANERFAGADEQGVYWGGEFSLPESVLREAGAAPRIGGVYRAALLKYEGGLVQGASHAGGAQDVRLFDTFEAVQTD